MGASSISYSSKFLIPHNEFQNADAIQWASDTFKIAVSAYNNIVQKAAVKAEYLLINRH
jgi:hypothetical protein